MRSNRIRGRWERRGGREGRELRGGKLRLGEQEGGDIWGATI